MKPDPDLLVVTSPLMRAGETWICRVLDDGTERWSRISPGELVPLREQAVEQADRFVNRAVLVLLWLATAYIFAHLLVAAGVGR